MKVTVFTSNQPRHLSLISALADVADEVFAIQECNTVFPGQVADFYRKTPVMQDYFSRVIAAEREVFGSVQFLPANVRQLAIKMGDVSSLDLTSLERALESDVFVVFGASYIKGELCERLIERRAVNIHMGVSPQYRGSSTNFWAMYDGRPQFVGATIHLLSNGLDSGPILFHAVPKPAAVNAFVHGMRAVRAAHAALIERIRSHSLFDVTPVEQDRSKELRYTRNADFTDEVATEYLARVPSASDLLASLRALDLPQYIRPVVR